MSAASGAVPFADKAYDLIAEHALETQARGIVFHTDFDSDLVFIEPGAGVREEALRSLIRFVIVTIPDGCEVYFALARPAAPVALVGAGVLTLRWQVAGDRRGGSEADVVALRPRLGDAQAHVVGKPAQALRADFKAAGWPLSLEAIQGGEELWVRAEVS